MWHMGGKVGLLEVYGAQALSGRRTISFAAMNHLTKQLQHTRDYMYKLSRLSDPVICYKSSA